MSFAAKYSGRCGACDGRIIPGEHVRYDRDHHAETRAATKAAAELLAGQMALPL